MDARAGRLLFLAFFAAAMAAHPEPLALQIPKGSTAFPLGKEIILLGPGGARRLAAWPGDARPRDAALFPGGFVAWDRGSLSVFRGTEAGLLNIGRIDAAQVFLSPDWALGRSELYAEKAGFSYAVYRLGPRLAAGPSFSLDCFPAECLFAGNRCYLAGADRDDRANRLYEIDLSTGKSRVIAELPKSRDFGRLVSDGKTLWYFLSPSLPRQAEFSVLSFRLDAERGAAAPKRLMLLGLPPASSSWYGSGFASGGRFWLPVASGEGKATRVSLYAFDPAGGRASAALALATGLYAPLAQAGDSFYAIGFLYPRDPGAFSLLAIKTGAGRAAFSSVALPLGSSR
jgi:hypothetical protein